MVNEWFKLSFHLPDDYFAVPHRHSGMGAFDSRHKMQKSEGETHCNGAARRWKFSFPISFIISVFLSNTTAAQNQTAVHVIQIGNTFYDVIPITNPSTSRCHHHSHCRRGFSIRHSDSNTSLNANSHSNPTFVLDEGIYPSGGLMETIFVQFENNLILAPSLEAPPSYDEVIRLPNQYPKLNSSRTVSPVNENPPPTIAEIEANGHSITTITSMSPAVMTNQQRNSGNLASVTWTKLF